MSRTATFLALALLGMAGGTRVRAGDPPPAPVPVAPPLLPAIVDEQDPGREAALAAWKALPEPDRVAQLRAALHGDVASLAFAAAAVVSPWNLDFDELRLRSRVLSRSPLAHFAAPAPLAEIAGERPLAIGSADLLELWRTLADANPAPAEFDYAATHRVLRPEDVPALVPLLASAKPTAFRALLYDLMNEANGEAGDERQDDYVRAFRYGLARLRAEAKGRPVPKAADVLPLPPKKGGLPPDFVELARGTWIEPAGGFDLATLPAPPPHEGAETSHGPFDVTAPDHWLHRWALRTEPVEADLALLVEVSASSRASPATRAWAARKLARLPGREAGRALRNLILFGEDAALFAAADLASRGDKEDWEKLSKPDSSKSGQVRAPFVPIARWLADPKAARVAAWNELAKGQIPEELGEGARWSTAYDFGIPIRDEDLAWIAAKLAEYGFPLEAEAWFVVNGFPDGVPAALAERLAKRWGGEARTLSGIPDVVVQALARFEVVAKGAVLECLRTFATDAAVRDVRRKALVLLARLGDAEGVKPMLTGPLAPDGDDVRFLGRVHDPEVAAQLRWLAKSKDPIVEASAVEGLAVLLGAPEPLARYLGPRSRTKADPKADGWDEAKALVVDQSDPIGAILRRTSTGTTVGGTGPLDWVAGFGLTRDPRVAERVRAWRDDRASGLYAVATACLAMQGDAAARADWRAFLGEGRTFLLDDLANGTLFTMNADPDLVAAWIARLDANCCLAWHAHAALSATYPTFPFDHLAGDAGRTRRGAEAWFARHGGPASFVWSPILDGWMPAGKR